MAQLKDLLVNGKSKFLDTITLPGIKLPSGGSDTTFWNTNGGTKTASDIVTSIGDGRYLPLTGGTLSKAADNILSINNTSSSAANNYIYFKNNGTNKASVGYYSNLAFIASEVGGYARIGIKDNGTPVYRDNGTGTSGGHEYILLHTGNYNSYALSLSGGTMSTTASVTNLNADLLDGKHASELLTATSITADGNKTKISVTVGGTSKDSSVIVPYSTSTGNLSGGAAGKIVYLTGANTTGFIDAAGEAGKVLMSTTSNGFVWRGTTNSVVANSTDLVTSGAVKTAIDNLPEPMVFKGTVGSASATTTSLPAASASNEGYTYKVISNGTYGGVNVSVGDTLISASTGSSSYEWVRIPSGDEPNGTVTSITIKGSSPITVDNESAITSSGTRTISHANSGVTAGRYGDTDNLTPNYGNTFKVPCVSVNATGHVTYISEHTVKIPASDNTDKALQVGASDEKRYLAGMSSTSITSTGSANASVYMLGGKLYSNGSVVLTSETQLSTTASAGSGTTAISGLSVSNHKITYTTVSFSLPTLIGSSAIGSTSRGIYWTGSAFASMSYTVEKSVPSNAIFTDYQVTTTTSASTIYLSGKTTTASNTGQEYLSHKVYMTDGTLNATTLSEGGTALSSIYLKLSGGTMSGTINGLTILPKTTTTYDLGSSSLLWNYIYAKYIGSTVSPATIIYTDKILTNYVGDSTLPVANVQTDSINGVTVGSSPKFTDLKVLHSESTTDSYRAFLLSYNTGTASGTVASATELVYYSTKLRVQPSSGNIITKGTVKLEAASSTSGGTMTYDATEECIKFTFA